MSSLKKRRKNINIMNKPQQWRSFSVDDIRLNKPDKIKIQLLTVMIKSKIHTDLMKLC